MELSTLLVVLVPLLLVLVLIGKSVRIIPQARAAVVERLGRFQRTLEPGLALVIPFVDRVRPQLDLREQVVSFPPQPVITEDNLLVNIDTVIYFQVTNAKDATYEIANFIQGIEQLTVTTLRNVVGSMNLERALTGRDHINGQLRGVLDEATGRWGIRVNRVELKAIEPPPSIRDSMEKQMRAERDRRAAILTAEGVKQAKILTAQGEKESAILRAQGERESRILEAQGQAKAIDTVFTAIHEGRPDPELLAYQYLQALPEIARGEANTMWIIPAEITKALEGIGSAVGRLGAGESKVDSPAPVRLRKSIDDEVSGTTEDVERTSAALAAAEAAAAEAAADVSGGALSTGLASDNNSGDAAGSGDAPPAAS